MPEEKWVLAFRRLQCFFRPELLDHGLDVGSVSQVTSQEASAALDEIHQHIVRLYSKLRDGELLTESAKRGAHDMAEQNVRLANRLAALEAKVDEIEKRPLPLVESFYKDPRVDTCERNIHTLFEALDELRRSDNSLQRYCSDPDDDLLIEITEHQDTKPVYVRAASDEPFVNKPDTDEDFGIPQI